MVSCSRWPQGWRCLSTSECHLSTSRSPRKGPFQPDLRSSTVFCTGIIHSSTMERLHFVWWAAPFLRHSPRSAGQLIVSLSSWFFSEVSHPRTASVLSLKFAKYHENSRSQPMCGWLYQRTACSHPAAIHRLDSHEFVLASGHNPKRRLHKSRVSGVVTSSGIFCASVTEVNRNTYSSIATGWFYRWASKCTTSRLESLTGGVHRRAI